LTENDCGLVNWCGSRVIHILASSPVTCTSIIEKSTKFQASKSPPACNGACRGGQANKLKFSRDSYRDKIQNDEACVWSRSLSGFVFGPWNLFVIWCLKFGALIESGKKKSLPLPEGLSYSLLFNYLFLLSVPSSSADTSPSSPFSAFFFSLSLAKMATSTRLFC
jgi:hypothetical protein